VVVHHEPTQPNPGRNKADAVISTGRLGRRPKGKKVSIINRKVIGKFKDLSKLPKNKITF